METTWLSPAEVGKRLDTTPATVLTWIRHGKLKAYKFGGTYKIKEADFKKFEKEACTVKESN